MAVAIVLGLGPLVRHAAARLALPAGPRYGYPAAFLSVDELAMLFGNVRRLGGAAPQLIRFAGIMPRRVHG